MDVIFGGKRTTEHPSSGMLSLFAGKDLSWPSRLRIQKHLTGCTYCEQQVLSVRSACKELKREAESETLTSFEAIADWSRLEREMLGNIAVGVSAARCIDHVHKGRKLLFKSVVGVGLALVFGLGWTTHVSSDQTYRLFSSLRAWAGGREVLTEGTVLRTLPEGIAVHSQGTTLTLMHPRSATISVSGNSTVSARFIDEDTGQVTIAGVYGQ